MSHFKNFSQKARTIQANEKTVVPTPQNQPKPPTTPPPNIPKTDAPAKEPQKEVDIAIK